MRTLPFAEHRRFERAVATVRIGAGLLALLLGTIPLERPNVLIQATGLALIAHGMVMWRAALAVRTRLDQERLGRLGFGADGAFAIVGMSLTLRDPAWIASIAATALILIGGLHIGRRAAIFAGVGLTLAYLVGVGMRQRSYGLSADAEGLLLHVLLYAATAWLAGAAGETTRRLSSDQYFAPLRQVIDSAHDAFIAIDDRGRIVEWSTRATELFGRPREDMIGRDSDELVPPRYRARVRSMGLSFRAGGTLRGRRVVELELLHRDGREIPVEIAISRAEASPRATLNAFVRDVSERQAIQRERERYLDHDALTGLPSARLLHQRLLETHVAAARTGPYAVLLLDLDHFHEVNAAFGHVAGDGLLVAVARRLESVVSPPAVIGRWSGDQFVVILPGVPRAEVETVAQAIVDLFSEPFDAAGRNVELGVSIGVAIHPDHGTEVPVLLGRADRALADAKRLTSTFAVFTGDEATSAPPRLPLRADLRRAIRSGGLTLVYQPIIRLRGGGVEAFEALARWHHPVHGAIPTDEFIDLAERTGLIRGLTEWALERAAADVARWRVDRPGLRVSVNLSTRAFANPAISERIEEIGRRLGGRPSGLAIEITESMLLSEPERGRERVDRWRAAGVRVDIDDFGTGYSSLAYLQRLDADAIKIDRQFVREMADDRRSETIVRAAIELGHELGFVVIAEGIEDERTQDLLAASGCDLGQGYYIGEPMAADAVPQWLEAWDRKRSPELIPALATHRRNVLVVEDDRSILGMIGDVLEEHGYRVEPATDGEEALALAGDHLDAVILDMHLPLMDGTEVARALRARAITVPLIAMTAGPSAARFAAEIGATAALAKPFDIDELVRVTERAVSLNSGAEAR